MTKWQFHKMRRNVSLRTALVASVIVGFIVTAAAQKTEPPPLTAATQPTRLPGQPPVGGGRYRNLRDEEDFSYLREERLAGRPLSDPWDALKFVPLNASGTRYLTVGGEARPRWERFGNGLWGEEETDNDGYFLQRFMAHADLRLGKITSSGITTRLFTQLKSGIIAANTAPPGGADRDDFDINQLFADVAFPLGARANGMGDGQLPSPDALTLRVGRQEMNYGSGRLISTREGPNVRIGFDGARAIVRRGAVRVDFFAVRPVRTRPRRFDDAASRERELVGVYGTVPWQRTKGVQSSLDLYYLAYKNDAARFDAPGVGRERRHSVGARWWGESRGWDFNTEAVVQWGKFQSAGGDLGVGAWTLATDNGYTWKDARTKPRLALKGDYASGDADPGDGRLGTFNPLFARGNYFGELGILGPYNLLDVHPTLDIEPVTDVNVTLDWDFFWRASARDGIYGFTGQRLREGSTSRARWIGHSPSVAVSWQVNRHLNLFTAVGYFVPGTFLRETPPSRPITYSTFYVTYKF